MAQNGGAPQGVIVSKQGAIPMQTVYLVAFGGMLINAFISPFLSILIGMGMNTVTITFWRLFLVGVTLMPIILVRGENRREITHMRAGDWPLFGLYCFTKLCGFLLYAEALRVGASAFTVSILTNITPVWMVIFLFVFFKERTPWQCLIGIAICICGVMYVGIENVNQLGADPISIFFGMASAASNAGNTLVGRSLRQKLSFLTLIGFSYFVCAVMSFFYALFVNAGFHVPTEAILVLGLLSWGCTMCGHSVNIWAIKYANPVTLSLISLGSPFLTAVTSFFLLGQVPKIAMLFGAVVVVSGLAINIIAEHHIKVRNSTPPLDDAFDPAEAAADLPPVEAAVSPQLCDGVES